MRYLKEQQSQPSTAANTSLRKRHSYTPLDYEIKLIKGVLEIQPDHVVPAMTHHAKQKWIPWLGVFISPFSMKNWRKRKEQAQMKHAGNRNQANYRKHQQQQQHEHDQWTSEWTTTDNHQQWQSTQDYDTWDTTQPCEHQSKRHRGSYSYSGPQSYGDSSSSRSTPWNSGWNYWYEDKSWHDSSW